MISLLLMFALNGAGAMPVTNEPIADPVANAAMLECDARLVAVRTVRLVRRFETLGALVESIASTIFRRPMIRDGKPDELFEFISKLSRVSASRFDNLMSASARAELIARLTEARLNPAPAHTNDPLANIVDDYEILLAEFLAILQSGDGHFMAGDVRLELSDAQHAQALIERLIERHAEFLRLSHEGGVL